MAKMANIFHSGIVSQASQYKTGAPHELHRNFRRNAFPAQGIRHEAPHPPVRLHDILTSSKNQEVG
jgi:hypothetical protein